ncbi:MAG TPA: Spy/CpxP family protein refolding chaperone [Roseiarcus sp.]|nr:Spy/CpxP family protein refolding chaperone [Roseiarcus sp.]
MTDADYVSPPPEPPLREPKEESGRDRLFTWPRFFALVGVLVFGLALGAGGLALAAGGFDHMGWGHGARLALVQRVVSHALDSIGASAEQEAKVHDIIAARFADIAPDPKEHEAIRKQAIDLLSAPTIDRAAVEKLRADVVARFDAKSKAVVAGILDVADQLTPAQRAALSAEIEAMAQHGPMGGWGGPHHGPFMDDGPDSGPDKD